VRKVLRRVRWLLASSAILQAEKRANAERDVALAERDRAVEEGDKARAAAEAMRAERDASFEERDRAVSERDNALRLIAMPRPELADEAATSRVRVRVPQAASGRRNLVVPVQGAIANREIEITRPFFETYCRRTGVALEIIDVPEAIPPAFATASLRPIVESCERFAIVQPHMIIRDGCPDLFAVVTEDKLGAMIEGRWTDRRQRCLELSELCDFSAPLPTEKYLNGDLLVMSRQHLRVLETLERGHVSRYRLDAQDALNASLYHSDVTIYSLPRDFNWIPYASEEFDWRWAWIFNMSSSWRSPPTQAFAWRPGADGSGAYLRARLQPQHCRLPPLIEIAEQLRGNTVRFVNAAEMSYEGLSARVHLTDDEAAVMWCGASAREGPAIYGPYLDLPAGRWSVSLLGPDGVTPADPRIVVDVVHDSGRNTVRLRGPIGPGATIEILLDRDVTSAEVRMYPGDRDYAVGCILFKACSESRVSEQASSEPRPRTAAAVVPAAV
jgi:hypothetical protein